MLLDVEDCCIGSEVTWLHTAVIPLPASEIVSLNKAYSHVVRRKKGGKGHYAQRFTNDKALAYKARWRSLFSFLECFDSYEHYDTTPEEEKPFIVFRFLLLYNLDDWAYSTGRLRGVDLSNLFKLIEDAYCEYIGLSDIRTLRIVADKRPTERYGTQVLVSVGLVRPPILFEEDFVLEYAYADLLYKKEEHVATLKPPKTVSAYASLCAKAKAQVGGLIKEHAKQAETEQALHLALDEFKSDTVMLLTVIGSMTKRGLLKPGLFEQLLPIMNKEAAPAEGPAKPPKQRHPTRVAMRGLLPFADLPKKPSMSKRKFLEHWERLNQRKRRYPADMLDASGGINWDSSIVFQFRKESPQWYVYRCLLGEQPTFAEILMLRKGGRRIRANVIETTLRKIMVEPSWLPPGAGTYREDPETGRMWIERDPAKSLKEAEPYIATA